MSATIGANDANFVVFGSGHDYTRIDSGDGRSRWFSHKKVPLGSRLYANQFLFYVPDEDGNRIDAVRFDMSHCTFIPALGTTFDTVGEQTIKVHYWREYIHDEESILVERELETVVEVVDHGNVASSAPPYFIYDDGYCYFQDTINMAGFVYLHNDNSYQFDKVSNIPFRVYDLKGFCKNSGCSDISELEDADTSQVQTIEEAFYGCDLTDISALAEWDLSYINPWGMTGKLVSVFAGNAHLEDISPLAKWDVSKAKDLSSLFASCYSLADLTPLRNWDVSNVTKMDYTFAMGSDYSAYNVNPIRKLDGLEKWDVSKVTSFWGTFSYLFWLEDISALANWDLSSGTNFQYMFRYCNVSDLDGITWDLSGAEHDSELLQMFGKSVAFKSSSLNKKVIPKSVFHLAEGNVGEDGNLYTDAQIGTLTSISHDADNASTWTVDVPSPNAFTAYDASTSGWTNIPSWN